MKLPVTSRERLSLQWEWTFELQGLPVPGDDRVEDLEAYSAVALFVHSARRARIDFALTAEDRPQVARICRLVEGMPLGIELAAAWSRTLSCREIAQEIERNLDFLAAVMRDAPKRHRSIRAAFDHSWNLLTGEERCALRRLSVFRGSFSREAAEPVAGASLALLSALVDKSLLQRMERYDLHELIRQYADLQLQTDSKEYADVYERHAAYYAARLEQWRDPLLGPRQTEVLAEMDLEIHNLRQAWSWLATHRRLEDIRQSLNSLALYHEIRGWFREGEALLGQAVEALGAADGSDAAHASVLGHLLARQAWFCMLIGENDRAQGLVSRSLAPLDSGDDREARANALFCKGMLSWAFGSDAIGRQDIRDSLTLYRSIGHGWGMAACLVQLSDDCFACGEIAEGDRLLDEAFSLMRSAGDPYQMATGLREVGARAGARGRCAEAQQLLDESLKMSRALNHRWNIAEALRTLAVVLRSAGETERAVAAYQESIDLFEETGESYSLALALSGLGNTLLGLERTPEAEQCFVRALRVSIETNTLPMALFAVLGIATLRAQTGKTETALELLMHVLQHPTTRSLERDRAESLRPDWEARLTPQQVESARSRAQAKTLEAVAAEILAD